MDRIRVRVLSSTFFGAPRSILVQRVEPPLVKRVNHVADVVLNNHRRLHSACYDLPQPSTS